MAKTRRKKKRTHVKEGADPDVKPGPRSFVFKFGKHRVLLSDLEKDLRKVMLPNTAQNLKVSKRNVMRDFVNIAGPLGVTHFMVLTSSDNASYLRVAKSPRGPTIVFKIHEYALMRDVAASMARPRVPATAFKHPPLLVMHNFGDAEHMKLATMLFQNLFPSINVQKVRLGTCQRVVLMTRDAATERISVRHYSIAVAPSRVNKALKLLTQRKDMPDMSKYTDIGEYVEKAGYDSQSEGEEAEASRVVLGQSMGKGNIADRQSRVRLHEIGPRLELEVIKVQEGVCEGKVLYHKFIQRTKSDVAAQDAELAEKRRVKAQRRAEQEDNVKRKAAVKEAQAEAQRAAQQQKRAGKAQQQSDGKQGKKKPRFWEQPQERIDDDVAQDDDAEYYRQEVGEEPDENFVRASRSGNAALRREQRKQQRQHPSTTSDDFTPREKPVSEPQHDAPNKAHRGDNHRDSKHRGDRQRGGKPHASKGNSVAGKRSRSEGVDASRGKKPRRK